MSSACADELSIRCRKDINAYRAGETNVSADRAEFCIAEQSLKIEDFDLVTVPSAVIRNDARSGKHVQRRFGSTAHHCAAYQFRQDAAASCYGRRLVLMDLERRKNCFAEMRFFVMYMNLRTGGSR